MILRSHLPGAILRESVTRAGDDAPSGGRETLDRRVADAAARPGEERRALRMIGLRGLHRVGILRISRHFRQRPVPGLIRDGTASVMLAQGYRRVLIQGLSGAVRRNSTRSCSREGGAWPNSMIS